jgi:MFS family permease
MSTTVALAMVADSSTGQNRGRMLGHYQAAQRIGFWLGPVAGGALAAALGLRASIWAYALLATLAIVPALFVRESRARGSAHAAPSLSAMRDLFRSRDFVLISVVSFVVFFTMTGAQFTALPLFADQELRLGPELIGVALFASSTVGVLAIYPSGILSDRYGRRAVVVGLALAGGAGLLLLVLVGDAVGLVLASLVLGGSNALRGPAMQAYVIDAGGGRSHGATAGVFRALGDLGSTVGPAVAALMFGLGYRPFFLVNATIVIVAALLFWRYASARPGEAATTAPAPLPAPRVPSRSPSR